MRRHVILTIVDMEEDIFLCCEEDIVIYRIFRLGLSRVRVLTHLLCRGACFLFCGDHFLMRDWVLYNCWCLGLDVAFLDCKVPCGA